VEGWGAGDGGEFGMWVLRSAEAAAASGAGPDDGGGATVAESVAVMPPSETDALHAVPSQ